MPEQKAAEEAGDWQAMLDAGAIALPAGCGPCIGLGAGLLEPGEVGISASNSMFLWVIFFLNYITSPRKLQG